MRTHTHKQRWCYIARWVSEWMIHLRHFYRHTSRSQILYQRAEYEWQAFGLILQQKHKHKHTLACMCLYTGSRLNEELVSKLSNEEQPLEQPSKRLSEWVSEWASKWVTLASEAELLTVLLDTWPILSRVRALALVESGLIANTLDSKAILCFILRYSLYSGIYNLMLNYKSISKWLTD